MSSTATVKRPSAQPGNLPPAAKAALNKGASFQDWREREAVKMPVGRQIRYGIYSTCLAFYTLVRKASPIFIFLFAWVAVGLPAGWGIAVAVIATMGAGLELIDPERY